MGEEGRSFELSDESAGEEDGHGDQLSALRREPSVTFPRGFSSKEDLEIGTPKLGGMMSSGGGGFGDAEDERKGNEEEEEEEEDESGSKMGLDATNKWTGETDREWGTPIVMDEDVKQRVDAVWDELGI